MAFPSSPISNQQATVNGVIYTYNSSKSAWQRTTSSSVNLTVNNVSVTTAITSPNLYISGPTTITGTVTLTSTQPLLPASNAAVDLGSNTQWFRTFYGKSTQAQYADLAENYLGDRDDYMPGTVMVFGGDKEVTAATKEYDSRVAGVVSQNPAYLMNVADVNNRFMVPVALTGRVPTKVQGPVTKGELLVTSNEYGIAQRLDNGRFIPGVVLGKALENIETNTVETIEVVIGRF
jgi:hypothetical protein